MGTDMHVAIEIRRKEYSHAAGGAAPKWVFIKSWTVDRCYDLFGCFGNIRSCWSNSISLPIITEDNMSWQLKQEKEYNYGFYEVKPEILTSKILGWSPPQNEWEDYTSCERPVIDKDWFFDSSVYLGDEVYKEDNLNYSIYKMMLKRYGKKDVRLVVYFDS